MSFLKQAIKAVPQVRWALGVLGVASAASLLFGLFANKLVAIAGTVAMLLLMMLLVVFARGVATLARTSLKVPALFLMWSAMILAIGAATLVISSLFFNEPITRQELLSLQLSDAVSNGPQEPITELSFTNEAKPISLDRLRQEMLQALPNRADDREIARSLAQNGSLMLKNSCLSIGDMTYPPRTVALSVRTLSLLENSCIITNGNNLELTVLDLVAAGGTIRAFEDSSMSPPTAPPGVPGANGHSGGSISIRVLGKIVGPIAVDLRGQNGGSGGLGQMGSTGVQGPRGSDASSGAFGCQHGGGDGGPGGRGGQGGSGFPGGDGGDGGNLTLFGRATEFADQMPSLNLKGGDRGQGGEGGAGAPGGAGGEGGSGGGFCGGGHGGYPGPTGPKGLPGSTGEKAGAEGKLLMLPRGA